MTDSEKINSIKMVYDLHGKVVNIFDNIVGIINENSKFALINLKNNKVIQEYYSIRYIGRDIFILYNMDTLHGLCIKSLIINTHTFDIIYSTDKSLVVENEIIYEEAQSSIINTDEVMNIFDLDGNKIGEIPNRLTRDTIKATDSDNYYISQYYKEFSDGNIDSNTVYEFYYYNKEEKILKKVWESDKYIIDNIGHGLYMFRKLSRDGNIKIKDTLVYDLVNMRVIK